MPGQLPLPEFLEIQPTLERLLTPALVGDFLRAIGRCEGIKGSRTFVLRALALVEREGNLSAVLQAFAQRWRERFNFNRTRCVFAFEDGACSLQAFSMQQGAAPHEFKPISCVMHPLVPTATAVTPPAAIGEPDSSDIGLEYPGFGSFTPCGQPRADGQPWRITFGEEITIWEARQRSR